MSEPKVVCVMAIHRRREVTLETFRLLKLQTVKPHIIAVGDSEYDHDTVRQARGVTWVQHANQPLSDKYQAGVDRARELDPDAIMIGGSDTWLSSNWIEVYLPYLEGCGMVGHSKVHVVLVERGSLKMMEWSYIDEKRKDPLGVGRLISRAALDAIDWELFPSGLPRNLDRASYLRVTEAGFQAQQIDLDEACLIGVQSPAWLTMNPWPKLLRSNRANRVHHPNPKRSLAERFPEALVSIATLRKKLNLPEWTMTPKVVCVMAIYGRAPIAIESIKMLQRQTVPLDIVLVGSGKTEQRIAERTGCHFYIRRPNSPLGAKHQAGVDLARDLGADVLMTTGSDTWITPNWLKVALPYLEKYGAVGKSQWYAMHLQPRKLEIISRQYAPHRAREAVGVGRLIHREVLNEIDWQVYSPLADRSLDGGVRRRLESIHCSTGILNHVPNIMTLGIKGPWEVITPWRRVYRSRSLVSLPAVAEPEHWLDTHFPGSLEALTRVRDAHWPEQEHQPFAISSKQEHQPAAGLVMLRYIGHKTTGKFAVWGGETNTRYQFGPNNDFTAYVYEDDADALVAYRKRRGRRGMVRQFEVVR